MPFESHVLYPQLRGFLSFFLYGNWIGILISYEIFLCKRGCQGHALKKLRLDPEDYCIDEVQKIMNEWNNEPIGQIRSDDAFFIIFHNISKIKIFHISHFDCI